MRRATLNAEDAAKAWQPEITRRLREVQEGSATLHDHEDVMLGLEEIVKK